MSIGLVGYVAGKPLKLLATYPNQKDTIYSVMYNTVALIFYISKYYIQLQLE